MSLSLYYFFGITAVNILAVWALYMPYRIGQLHITALASMAFSAYLAAYLVLELHTPFALALVAGFGAGACSGFFVGLFIKDAPRFSVVIVGLTFFYLLRTAVENSSALGGTMGLFGLPDIGDNPQTHRIILLGILYALVGGVGFFIWRFDHSMLGRAASALFADRDLAISLGVDVKKMGLLLQTISCTIAGGTGVVYVWLYKSIHPDYFAFSLIGLCMTILFVGGHTTLWGTLVAAPLLTGLPFLLPPALQSLRSILYGILLGSVLMLKPEGFITRTIKRHDATI